MPSGRTHDRITFFCLIPLGILAVLFSRDAQLTLILLGGFLFSGLMFGPDLDIHSVQFNRWGWFKFVWLPYRKILRHRGIVSHGPIIGTVFRIIYLSIILLIVSLIAVGIAQLIWGFSWNWQTFARYLAQSITQKYYREAIACVIGLELGAMSHSLSDWLGSAYKRSQKKRLVQKHTIKTSRKKKNPPPKH